MRCLASAGTSFDGLRMRPRSVFAFFSVLILSLSKDVSEISGNTVHPLFEHFAGEGPQVMENAAGLYDDLAFRLATLRLELAAIRFERSMDRLARLLKAYDPDQPRVPAGNTDGGQWTDGDAGNRNATGSHRMPIRLANYYTGDVNGKTAGALGMTRLQLGAAIHSIKAGAGLGGSDNVLIHIPSGDVFFNGENIGNVFDEN